ncbi:MAG: SH3 domain-containing protein [Treponema sp.]|nr:SH3 domain-containing protein [Treponema sp.]
MRIVLKQLFSQLCLILCFALLSVCSSNKDETPVIPPETSPLTSEYIGIGVITDSFTHITVEPSNNSNSLGYLRRGSLVTVIKRQNIKTPEGFVSWVLISGDQPGWLKESVMDIYNNENQAKTASESMFN